MTRGLAAIGVVLAFGCGGAIWQEFHGEELSMLYLQVEDGVPPSDPGRAPVLDALTDVWVGSWEHGGLGFWQAVSLDMAVEDAIGDGQISPGEVRIVRERADALMGDPVDAARRLEILEIKATYDERARAERGLEQGAARALPAPELPQPVETPVAPGPGLRDGLEASGWTIASCASDQMRCSATRGALEATVDRIDDPAMAEALALAPPAGVAVRRSGSGVVAVTVRDAGTPSEVESEALADALTR